MTPPFDVIATGFQFVEAPRVDAAGCVYFSDLTGGGFYRVMPGAPVETLLPGRLWIGGAVLDEDGTLVLSGKGGLLRLDPRTGRNEPLLVELGGRAIIAVNDIEADRHGGIFGGTIDFAAVFERGEVPGGGQFFYLSNHGQVRILREQLAVSNGIGFSPDGTRMYHCECTQGIWTYTLGADGMPGEAHMFARLDDCDGLAVDADGGIWVACWNSARILRYRPDGSLDLSLTLPFPHLVSLCFGGPDLGDLYVATGGDAEHPRMGGIVRLKSQVRGLPVHKSRLGRRHGS
jgi:sugar lactone lactonase YvrE